MLTFKKNLTFLVSIQASGDETWLCGCSPLKLNKGSYSRPCDILRDETKFTMFEKSNGKIYVNWVIL